ncbi:unnamed protein product, partial [marine sediment metagenome]
RRITVMTHTIKVSDETYQELESLLEPRETFDGVVGRLLKVYKTIKEVAGILGPSHYLKSKTPPGQGD